MNQKEKFSLNQDIASNPTENIWVQANAGTGKTTVLIRRLLRILFRNSCREINKSSGILCLSYTNAAAGEMRNRVLDGLRNWSKASDDELRDLLSGISENEPANDVDLAAARRVFFSYIDNPDMLKIKTIHGFCEEILRRFPIEAGISPTWSLVSGAAQTVLLQDAFNKMINNSLNNAKNIQNTMDAFSRIIDIKSEHFLSDLNNMLLSHYKSFFQVEDTNKYREYFIDKTKHILNLDTPVSMDLPQENLIKIIDYAENIKKPAQYVINIINITKQYIDNSVNFEKYKDLYLTSKNTIRSILEKDSVFSEEAKRVCEIQQYLLNKKVFDNTLSLFDLAMDFADTYKTIKQERNLLDFEDLILYTQRLFRKPDVMGWVLSQLDVSISHILVDEAQDTSPQQWNIMKMLAGDFFTDGDKENNRSLFVVGDTKQSIYGFQNADPVAFAESRADIAEQIQQNYRTIKEIPLDQSFRSVEPVLKTVDYFFSHPSVVADTGFHNNAHVCYRRGEPGFVEMHNLLTYEDKTHKNRLYVYDIADKIEKLIKDDGYKPSDIMVLLQKRGSFAGPLLIELKRRGIDVAGSDRIKLPQFPAVKDLLHMVRFCIDNNNDYGLCCVLKSPFYRLKEQDIFNLCKIKNESENASVFDCLTEYNRDVYDDLNDIIEKSKTLAPYSFFEYVLHKNNNREKIISAMGKHVIDPIEEFMSMCLAYERTQPGTLRHFIKWFITGDSEVKRDMDESAGVRIMTVHGSKGLASPVVFLIDTVYFPQSESTLNVNYLDKNSDDYDLWLWKTDDSDIIQQIADKNKQDAIAEYYRLLYVAMTRTRDRLYIYGCDANVVNDLSWHRKLWSVLSNIADARLDENTIRITNDTKFD